MSDQLSLAGLALSAILAGGGLAAVVWVFARVKGVEATVDILNNANEGLRKANGDLELGRLADREEFGNRLKDQERECATALAALKGQVDTLSGGLVDRIVTAVHTALAEAPK